MIEFMPMFCFFAWLTGALLLLVVLGLALVVAWSVWRMTVAHERIERHLAAIERRLAESSPPGG